MGIRRLPKLIFPYKPRRGAGNTEKLFIFFLDSLEVSSLHCFGREVRPTIMEIRLKFVDKDGKGDLHEFAVKGKRVTIGRDPNNRICIPKTFVSARHAIITLNSDGDYFIDDCASRNGTFVNGDRVVETHKIELGDLIRFGTMEYRFAEAEEASALPPVPLPDDSSPPPSLETKPPAAVAEVPAPKPPAALETPPKSRDESAEKKEATDGIPVVPLKDRQKSDQDNSEPRITTP